MSEPAVTVLMPVYNASLYLDASVKSILNQTYANFQLLVINDASTDNSKEMLLSYNDPRIIYLENEKNLGVVGTLNKGLENISTRYIVRMDADDIAVPERLKWQVDFMESNPDIGLSGGHMEIFGDETALWKAPLDNNTIKATLLFNSPFFHPTVIIRNEILKKNALRYSFQFPHQEDYDLWCRMSANTKFANLDKVLLKYRREGQNITVKESATYGERKIKFFTHLLDDFGIKASENELKLHAGVLPMSRQNTRLYHSWLQKLEMHNLVREKYPHAELQQVIKRKWEQLFFSLASSGITSVSYWITGKHITKAQVNYFLRLKAKHLLNYLKLK